MIAIKGLEERTKELMTIVENLRTEIKGKQGVIELQSKGIRTLEAENKQIKENCTEIEASLEK